jgi:hypothetical protein
VVAQLAVELSFQIVDFHQSDLLEADERRRLVRYMQTTHQFHHQFLLQGDEQTVCLAS